MVLESQACSEVRKQRAHSSWIRVFQDAHASFTARVARVQVEVRPRNKA